MSGGSLLVERGFSTEVPKAMIKRITKSYEEFEANGITPCLMEPKEALKIKLAKTLVKALNEDDDSMFSKCATINESTEQDVELDDLFIEEKSSLEKRPTAASKAKTQPMKRKSHGELVEDAARRFAKDIQQSKQKAPPEKKKRKTKTTTTTTTVQVQERQVPLLIQSFAESILTGEVDAEEPCALDIQQGDTVDDLMQRNSAQFIMALKYSNYIKDHL